MLTQDEFYNSNMSAGATKATLSTNSNIDVAAAAAAILDLVNITNLIPLFSMTFTLFLNWRMEEK